MRLGLEVKGNLGGDEFPSEALANKAHKSRGESRALRWLDAVQVGPGGHLHLSGALDTPLSFTVGKKWSKSAEGDIHMTWSSISNNPEGMNV